MGSKSTPSTTTQVVKNDPPAYLQPYLTKAADASTALYNSGGGFFQGSTVAPFSSQTQQALDLTQARALSGSPLERAAQGNIQSTIAGDYLNSNSYLDQALDAANRNTIRQFREATMPSIQGNFARAGRYGSNSYNNAAQGAQTALAQTLSDTNAKAYADNYNQERTRQMQAIGMAPALAAQDFKNLQALQGVGSAYDAQAQAQLRDQVSRAEQQRIALNEYIQRLSGVAGDYGQKTGVESESVRTSGFANALGGASTGAGIGAKVGGPWGALAGAVIGGIGGSIF